MGNCKLQRISRQTILKFFHLFLSSQSFLPSFLSLYTDSFFTSFLKCPTFLRKSCICLRSPRNQTFHKRIKQNSSSIYAREECYSRNLDCSKKIFSSVAIKKKEKTVTKYFLYSDEYEILPFTGNSIRDTSIKAT